MFTFFTAYNPVKRSLPARPESAHIIFCCYFSRSSKKIKQQRYGACSCLYYIMVLLLPPCNPCKMNRHPIFNQNALVSIIVTFMEKLLCSHCGSPLCTVLLPTSNPLLPDLIFFTFQVRPSKKNLPSKTSKTAVNANLGC